MIPSQHNSARNPPSLLLRITIALIALIVLVFTLHGLYLYKIQRAELLNNMHQSVEHSLQRLSTNIGPFMEAYAINDYEQLVATETALENHFAVVVRNRKMGEILGDEHYISGQIITDAGDYTGFDHTDPQMTQRLDQAFYSDTLPITGSNGDPLGSVSVYASNEPLLRKLQALLIEEIIISVLFAAVLTFLLIFVLRRYFLRSIQHIGSALKHSDDEGIPLRPLPRFKYQEVQILSQTINTMLESIKNARAKQKVQQLRLENTITGTRTGTWEWNVATGETIFNERWAEIVGYTLAELEPVSIHTWEKLTHPEDLKLSSEQLQKHFQGELDYYECEVRMRHKQGHWVWVIDRGCVMTWSDQGEPLVMYGTHQDISTDKEAQEQLSMAAGVFKYAREGIILTSVDGIILDANRAFTALTGYHRSELTGHRYDSLIPEKHDQAFFNSILDSLRRDGVWNGEFEMPCKNGTSFPSLMTIAAARDHVGRVQHFVTLVADVSSLKQNEDRLRMIAHYDGLTGLPNRLLLTERLRHAITVARRNQTLLAVVFLDLDGFKEVNDTYGHSAGDELLKVLSDRMQQTLRDCDTVARLGGDEFVILLPDLARKENCRPVLERLLTSLCCPVTLSQGHAGVSASIGVSLSSLDKEVDADILIRQADMAMYQAKQNGKNRFCFFSKETADYLDSASA
ncbi:PAS domain S-box-containing protein/diguanylate cyclase (GGDEF) domain-containing protein [Marinobacter persicus]|uniref:PAS domain S-box-containing protein/diguanylate cyclase (GGDEF) domain-containing protein n=1 Tax=Marinobacter persicus TaxID=930118 RepID=A0A1I3P1Z2_9GAMM|nr:sensor domain-containing diguanylate cyclase [Marinobacter persicus]GHD51025.1 hypothetical protein GCM10008110_22400 [Marinobacter persicus]SFJ15558.1 PAS domain S-box-containing protein/diguanylate cyclase (GGDEF) domain-containing protein [Marinobacter persicus]